MSRQFRATRKFTRHERWAWWLYADDRDVCQIIIARLGRPCYLHAVLNLLRLQSTPPGHLFVTSSTRHRSRARHINFISTTSTDVFIGIFDGRCHACSCRTCLGCGLGFLDWIHHYSVCTIATCTIRLIL